MEWLEGQLSYIPFDSEVSFLEGCKLKLNRIIKKHVHQIISVPQVIQRNRTEVLNLSEDPETSKSIAFATV